MGSFVLSYSSPQSRTCPPSVQLPINLNTWVSNKLKCFVLYFFLRLLYVAYTSSGFFCRPLLRFVYDETLQIINKSKHSKKGCRGGGGRIQGEKQRKNPCPRRQKNHQKRANHQGTSSSQTPSCHEKQIKFV